MAASTASRSPSLTDPQSSTISGAASPSQKRLNSVLSSSPSLAPSVAFRRGTPDTVGRV